MADGSPLKSKAAVLAYLRGEIERCEAGGPGACAPAAVPTGIGPLDRLLPAGGLPAGSLADWICPVEGGGAWTLALLAAAGVCRDGQPAAIIDPVPPGGVSPLSPRGGRPGRGGAGATGGLPASVGALHPPGLAPLLPLDRVVIVRPAGRVRLVWALEQCLRCPAIGAVVAAPAPADRLDGIVGRKLARAAEIGGGVGFLIRRPDAPAPAAAAVRVRVEPLPSPGRARRFRVDLERARGLAAPAGARVEVDLETGRVSALAGLPDAAVDRSAG